MGIGRRSGSRRTGTDFQRQCKSVRITTAISFGRTIPAANVEVKPHLADKAQGRLWKILPASGWAVTDCLWSMATLIPRAKNRMGRPQIRWIACEPVGLSAHL
jgi:hypothetical protein